MTNFGFTSRGSRSATLGVESFSRVATPACSLYNSRRSAYRVMSVAGKRVSGGPCILAVHRREPVRLR